MAEAGSGSGEELGAFHRRYWAAWDGCDLPAMEQCLDPDFCGTFAGPQGAPVLEVDRAAALTMIEASFAQARGAVGGWRRSGLLLLRRGADEVVAAMRVECAFAAHPDWNNAELTVETYRRGPDGLWRILRMHSERLR